MRGSARDAQQRVHVFLPEGVFVENVARQSVVGSQVHGQDGHVVGCHVVGRRIDEPPGEVGRFGDDERFGDGLVEQGEVVFTAVTVGRGEQESFELGGFCVRFVTRVAVAAENDAFGERGGVFKAVLARFGALVAETRNGLDGGGHGVAELVGFVGRNGGDVLGAFVQHAGLPLFGFEARAFEHGFTRVRFEGFGGEQRDGQFGVDGVNRKGFELYEHFVSPAFGFRFF